MFVMLFVMMLFVIVPVLLFAIVPVLLLAAVAVLTELFVLTELLVLPELIFVLPEFVFVVVLFVVLVLPELMLVLPEFVFVVVLPELILVLPEFVLPELVTVVTCTAALEVSLISIDAVAPCDDTVKFSLPSVRLSAKMLTEIVALPSVPTTAVPLNCPPTISADCTPLMV